MVRPAKNSDVPGAQERIERAFLSLMDEMPLHKISVKLLCERAGCNKTTFYYHFESADAVLAAIEEACIPRNVPHEALSAMETDPEGHLFAPFDTSNPHFSTFCKLLGPKGDPSFAPRVKQAMYEEWCLTLGIDPHDVSPYNRMFTMLVLGGSLGLYADRADGLLYDAQAHADVIEAIVAPHIERLFREEIARPRGDQTS